METVLTIILYAGIFLAALMIVTIGYAVHTRIKRGKDVKQQRHDNGDI